MERKLLQERKEAIRRQVSTNDVVLFPLTSLSLQMSHETLTN